MNSYIKHCIRISGIPLLLFAANTTLLFSKESTNTTVRIRNGIKNTEITDVEINIKACMGSKYYTREKAAARGLAHAFLDIGFGLAAIKLELNRTWGNGPCPDAMVDAPCFNKKMTSKGKLKFLANWDNTWHRFHKGTLVAEDQLDMENCYIHKISGVVHWTENGTKQTKNVSQVVDTPLSGNIQFWFAPTEPDTKEYTIIADASLSNKLAAKLTPKLAQDTKEAMIKVYNLSEYTPINIGTSSDAMVTVKRSEYKRNRATRSDEVKISTGEIPYTGSESIYWSIVATEKKAPTETGETRSPDASSTDIIVNAQSEEIPAPVESENPIQNISRKYTAYVPTDIAMNTKEMTVFYTPAFKETFTLKSSKGK